MGRLLLVLVFLVGSANSAAFGQIAVVQRNVNLRNDPSSGQPPIRRLRPPEEVILIRLAKTSNYYNVRTEQGETGWRWANNVDIEDRLPNWDPANIPPYDRREWKHWVDADGDCQNARQEVLIRDADGPITVKTTGECDVESGTWVDPFGGGTLTVPSDLHIDHMVPLLNARTPISQVGGRGPWSARNNTRTSCSIHSTCWPWMTA